MGVIISPAGLEPAVLLSPVRSSLEKQMQQVATDDGSTCVQLKHLAAALYEQRNGRGKLIWSEILRREHVTEILDERIRQLEEDGLITLNYYRKRYKPDELLRIRLGIKRTFGNLAKDLPNSALVQNVLDDAGKIARENGSKSTSTVEIVIALLNLLISTNDCNNPEVVLLVGLIDHNNLEVYLREARAKLREQ